MYAKVKDGTIEVYPYSVTDLRLSRRDVSWPNSVTDETLAEFGVFPVESSAHPEYNSDTQQLVESQPELINAVWKQVWNVVNLSAEVILAKRQARTQELTQQFDQALTLHLDTVAQSKRYDNRISCAVRAGFAGPFQAEGVAFATWMDSCNSTAYQILADVQQGLRSPPASIEAFIAELPVIVWPE